MAKRSDAIFSANLPKRKERRVGAIVSGVGLALFLAATLLLMPREVGALAQRALGLFCAAWVWLTWWLATHQEESLEELIYRVRRSQSSDFGKQLVMNRPPQKKIKLPGMGEVAVVTLVGPLLFVLTFAWWLSPLAPVRVARVKLEDMTIPLGEQIIAAALVMPNGHTALVSPPAVPERAVKIGRLIRDKADAYQLGIRAIAEGRFADARKLLETASKEGKADPMRVELARGQNEIYAGQSEAAVPLLEAALAKSPDDPVILCQIAAAWIYQHEPAKAEPLLAQALKRGDKGPAAAGVLHLQAVLAALAGKDYESAQELCRKSRIGLRDAGEAEQENLIAPASLNNQAVLYLLCGKYYGAEELFKNAQDGWRQLSGENHPDSALVLANLAILDASLARYPSADARLDQAQAILKEASATVSKEIPAAIPLRRIAALAAQAMLSTTQAEFEQARKLLAEARAAAEKQLGTEHPVLPVMYELAGELFLAEGFYKKAEGDLLRAQALAKQEWGAAHPFQAAILNDLTAVYIEQGRFDEAAAAIKQVLAICDRLKASNPAEAAIAYYHRGLAAIRQEKPRDARADLDKALAIERDVYGEKNAQGVRTGEAEHPDIARTLGRLASLDSGRQTYANGVSLFGKAIAMAEKLLGADHPLVAELLLEEAKLHLAREKTDEARECLDKALDVARKRLPPTHPLIAAVLETLAGLDEKLDPPQTEAAEKLRAEAKELRRKLADEDRAE